LSGHFKAHEQDKHSRHGLLRMINHRRSLLQYLRQTRNDSYRELIERLGLRK
jgi:small subunit ribosomal protein S15